MAQTTTPRGRRAAAVRDHLFNDSDDDTRDATMDEIHGALELMGTLFREATTDKEREEVAAAADDVAQLYAFRGGSEKDFPTAEDSTKGAADDTGEDDEADT